MGHKVKVRGKNIGKNQKDVEPWALVNKATFMIMKIGR